MSKVQLSEAEDLISRIRSLNSDIANLDEVRKVSSGIQDTLHSTVGSTYSPNIDVASALPDDAEKLMQTLLLKVGDDDDGYRGDIAELSLGGANLIYLSLKLLEYESKLSSDRVAHFLLIEEPEAHIHTHVQMTLFDKYEYKNTQVFISTHSTHVSAASRIRSINIMSRGNQLAEAFQPAAQLEDTGIKRIERYLDALRSTLLFAKGVVLVEGDAELILVPNLFRSVFGISLDEIGVSLVNMSSTAFTNIAELFHDHRIRRHCAILTDLDSSVVSLDIESDDDGTTRKFKAKCKNAQDDGAERKNKLDRFSKDNKWVAPFYAEHTFEVDFLVAGNGDEIVACLPDIYIQNASKEKSTLLLRNKDVAVCGREVLRLAGKEGKGWFALLVAEHICAETYIPPYVLRAISFASSGTIKNAHYRTMGLYRMMALFSVDRVEEFGVLSELESEDFVEQFLIMMPEDQLSSLIRYARDYDDTVPA